jgi:hypothetical protein
MSHNRVLYSERHEAGAKGDTCSLWDERRKIVDCPVCHEPCTPASSCNLPCSHRFHAQCITWQDATADCPVCRADALLGACKLCFEPLRAMDLSILTCNHSFHSACATKIMSAPTNACPICHPESIIEDPTPVKTKKMRKRGKDNIGLKSVLVSCFFFFLFPFAVMLHCECSSDLLLFNICISYIFLNY